MKKKYCLGLPHACLTCPKWKRENFPFSSSFPAIISQLIWTINLSPSFSSPPFWYHRYHLIQDVPERKTHWQTFFGLVLNLYYTIFLMMKEWQKSSIFCGTSCIRYAWKRVHLMEKGASLFPMTVVVVACVSVFSPPRPIPPPPPPPRPPPPHVVPWSVC